MIIDSIVEGVDYVLKTGVFKERNMKYLKQNIIKMV